MSSVRLRTSLCLLLTALLIRSVLPCAFAESLYPAAEPSSEASAFTVSPLWPSAEAAILSLMEEYEVYDSGVALAYYNTVTEEEFFVNPGRYMDAASLYKVPLNMVYAERVANGELDPDGEIGVIPYSTLMEETLIYSSNDMAAVLIAQFNSYHTYRRVIAPYMGEDPDAVDAKYYENNFFTPRQMLACLKLLYSAPERFPSIYETMQKAHPNEYFCRDEHRYTIAHKYGWNEENGVLSLNDCAIVPTQDPIILVLFTAGINRQADFLTAFCTRCIDYTESITAVRVAMEEAERLSQETAAAHEAAEPVQAAGMSDPDVPFSDPAPVSGTADDRPSPSDASAESSFSDRASSGSAASRAIVLLALLGFVCIVSGISFIRRLLARQVGPTLFYLALFVPALALLLLACRLIYW